MPSTCHPVSQGDIFRLARREAAAIGIIDGYFDHVPAVWHKEILWAMSRGIHVYGSASMRALRAAELDPSGWRASASSSSTSATAFSKTTKWRWPTVWPSRAPAARPRRWSTSGPPLDAAEAATILSTATRAALTELAKAMFYPDRSYALLLVLDELRLQGAPYLQARDQGLIRDLALSEA